jgi:hypothetical protein
LETLGSEDELEQFNFTGREFAGNLFFALDDRRAHNDWTRQAYRSDRSKTASAVALGQAAE